MTRRAWFEQRGGVGFADWRKYALNLERRITEGFSRIRTGLVVEGDRITNIIAGGTLSDDTPEDVSLASGSAGTSAEGARSDHAHFLDENSLFALHAITAGAGLTGGGALNTDPTIDIVAADDTIIVNADSIQVNIPELETQLDQNIEEVLIVGDDANGQQIFSLGRLWISHPTSPLLDMVEEDAPADEGSYRWRQASGLFLFSTYSDAGTFGANIVQVDRTGTTPDLWTFGCDVDMNGNDILMGAGQVTEVGGIDWTGTISTAGSENTANAHSVYSRNVGDTADVRIWDFDSSDNLNISDSNSATIRMRSGGQIQLRPNGSGSNEYAFTSATADWNTNNLINLGSSVQFDTTATPVIDQEDIVSGDGALMRVRAQTSSGGTGAGGALYLEGGGPKAEASNGGAVHLRANGGAGWASILQATPTSVELLKNTNLNGFDLDTEDGNIEIGTGSFSSDAGVIDILDDLDLNASSIRDADAWYTDGLTVASLLDPGATYSLNSGICIVNNASTGITLCWFDGSNWIDVQTMTTVTT